MYRKTIFMVLMFGFLTLLSSCFPFQNVKTDQGNDLPPEFVQMYDYLELADDFYWSAKESLRRADEKDLVKEQYKDKIVKVLKAYNDTKSGVQASLKTWYASVNEGDSEKEQAARAAISGMTTLVDHSEQLAVLISEATDGEINLNSSLAQKFNKMLNEVVQE